MNILETAMKSCGLRAERVLIAFDAHLNVSFVDDTSELFPELRLGADIESVADIFFWPVAFKDSIVSNEAEGVIFSGAIAKVIKSGAGFEPKIAWYFTNVKNRIIVIGDVYNDAIELKEKNFLLRQIIDKAPSLIYWKDLNSNHLGCNEIFAGLAGIKSPEEIVGLSDFDLTWASEAKLFQCDDRKVMTENRPKLDIVEILPTASGDTLDVITNKVPLVNFNGDVVGLLGTATDISVLRKTQKELESALQVAEHAEKKRKEFVMNQAHDINTSIAGIVYASYEIQVANSLEEAQGIAPRIALCAERLQEYNKSLLRDLAWLDGEGRVISQRTEIRDTLKKLYDMNVLAADTKGLTLTVKEPDNNVPLYLVVDELVLFQCLQNLVANAIKFTKTGEVIITLNLLETLDDNRVLVAFHVKDTGRGIKPEHKRYIFDDYYKALPSNQADKISGLEADEDKGRGLGLTLSKKHAEGMKGELDLIWSEENKGSEFVLTLPLKVALNQKQ